MSQQVGRYQQYWRHLSGIGLAALALAETTAFGLHFGPTGSPLETLPRSSKQVMLTPFGLTDAAKPQGFSLFDHGQITFTEAVRSLLRDHLNSPVVEVRA